MAIDTLRLLGPRWGGTHLKPLTVTLLDPEPNVRVVAIQAMAQLRWGVYTDPYTDPYLTPLSHLSRGEDSLEALSHLVTSLQDVDPTVRLAAVRALTEAGEAAVRYASALVPDDPEQYGSVYGSVSDRHYYAL